MLPKDRAVLFADDDPNDRFLIEHACGQAQIAHPVVLLEDGEEVIAYLERRGRFADRARHPEPGLIVLDLKMPKRSGFETLAWIRKSPTYKCLPVLILSASLALEDVTEAYALAANAFMIKPSSAKELLELISGLKTAWLKFNEFPPLCRNP
jgi:CheY-like chemotaxis protein